MAPGHQVPAADLTLFCRLWSAGQERSGQGLVMRLVVDELDSGKPKAKQRRLERYVAARRFPSTKGCDLRRRRAGLRAVAGLSA